MHQDSSQGVASVLLRRSSCSQVPQFTVTLVLIEDTKLFQNRNQCSKDRHWHSNLHGSSCSFLKPWLTPSYRPETGCKGTVVLCNLPLLNTAILFKNHSFITENTIWIWAEKKIVCTYPMNQAQFQYPTIFKIVFK